MPLSPEQLNNLIEKYATMQVDNMDQKTLEIFVYDTIVENMSQGMGEEEILENIANTLDEDQMKKMLESVG
jgi:hypothetical protein